MASYRAPGKRAEPLDSRAMPRDLAKPPPKSRYSYAAATLEVEKQLTKRGRGAQKQVAGYCNLTEQQFSHRMRGVYAFFEIEHFGAIADFLRMPPGWPFVPLAEEKKKR